MTQTRGYGIMNHTVVGDDAVANGQIDGSGEGERDATDNGKATTYGTMNRVDRETNCIMPGTEVYAGMVAGEHNRENGLTVNIIREKHLTNMRTSFKDQSATINKTKDMSLEEALEYIADDEYCEVTPVSIRLRKKILNQGEREKAARKSKRAE